MFAALALSFTRILAGTGKDLVNKGLEYIKNDNFPMAMHYFTKSMEAAEREGDTYTLMVSNGYIANIYFNIYDYTRCIQYLEKGYSMAVKNKDVRLQGSYLTNLVAAYCKTGNAEKAWKYYRILESIKPTGSFANFQYYKTYNRARIATTEGKLEEALEYHKNAMEWAKNNGMSEEYVLFQYCEIGEILLKQGHYDQAILYGEACIGPAKRINERDLLTSVYKMLADSYGLKGNTQQESEYRRLYLTLSDSLFNRTQIFSADKDLVEYETRQNNAHINSLNGVISRQTVAIIVISLVVFTLVVFSLLLYRYNRKLRMAHLALINKNTELVKSEKEREKMLEQLLEKDESSDEMGKNSIGLNKEQSNTLLNKIIKIMSDINVIANPDFNLNALAEAVGSNTRYVSWIINDTYGKNFKTLLNEHRIHEACQRLADHKRYRNMTMQAIYEDVGYTNAVSFIRAFKKVNGMTPSEYQKILEQNTKSQ